MNELQEHPTVKHMDPDVLARAAAGLQQPLNAAWLRHLCLAAGADDAGFVELDRPELADQRAEILALLPSAKSVVSLVRRMSRQNIRTPARTVANLEFHHAGDELNDAARHIVAELERRGVRAVSPPMGFPMEMDRWGGAKTWVVSHKPIAVAAGLGRMGIHRNVIHPKFGNFILLGTVVLDAEISEYSRPIDYNPCLECKLCVAACPTGAIGSDGHFNFSACYTHNYREFMGGFVNWVEQIADSGSAKEYRSKVRDSETASMWQSLSYGANYKAAYCLAACPAGEEVIAPFLNDRARFTEETVRPLQRKKEPVYVVPGSDAEEFVARRYPHKEIRRVSNGLRAGSIRNFLGVLPHIFERGRSEGLNATFHFTFTGEEQREATVVIRDKKIEVSDGHRGKPDLRVIADSRTWLRFLSKEANLLWAILRGKIRLRGSPLLLQKFGKCFPS